MLYDELVDFEKRLRKLRLDVVGYERVQKRGLMKEAEALSILWFTSLKPQIEGLGAAFEPQVADVSVAMDRLHNVSRPNNRATSYDAAIKAALNKFKDRFLKPIQLAKPEEKTNVVLDKVLGRINDPSDPEESSYLKEAIVCAKIGYWRASVVMGWCAAIDRLQQTIGRIGFDKFNEASTRLKNKTTGKFKNWNKGVQANNLSELQAIFDKDLLTVLEEMNLIAFGSKSLENRAKLSNTLAVLRSQDDHQHLVAFRQVWTPSIRCARIPSVEQRCKIHEE